MGGKDLYAEFERLVQDSKKESYERGWNDAVKAFEKLLEGIVKGEVALPRPKVAPKKAKRAKKGLVPDTVRSVLADGPMRYTEVVRSVCRKYPEIKKASVRSALKKMRSDGVVNNDAGNWFLVQHSLINSGVQENAGG